MCFSAKSTRGSRATVRPGRAFRLLRACAIVFLIILIACQPAAAASTTDSQIMMMSDEDDPDAGISPFVLVDDTTLVSIALQPYDSLSFKTGDVKSSDFVPLSDIPDLWFGLIDPVSRYDGYDQVMVSIIFKNSDGSTLTVPTLNYLFSVYPFYFYANHYGSDSDIYDYDVDVFSAIVSGRLYVTGEKLIGSNLIDSSSIINLPRTVIFPYYGHPSIAYSQFNYSADMYADEIYFSFFLDRSKLSVPDSDRYIFSLSVVDHPFNIAYSTSNSGSSAPDTSSQLDSINQSISSTINSVNQVNQSIQQTISAVQQVSADLAALSNAVQQMTQQFLSGLEQQTNAISSLVTAQIQQIRQDLGLVNDNLSSGFSSVTNSITNQTQQVTQKIDTLQQNVVNKLDTVNQSITDLTDETKQGFDDVKKGITDLPGKIGEMLKSLIVPDSEQLVDKYSDFTDLAEEKLGVIYQVPEMVFEMAQTVVNGVTNQETQMQLPAFKLVMPDAEYTLWEEQKFDIWPAGTEAIQNAVQLATSMLCVILTFNSLKRKYEEWLDGR